MSLSNNSKRKRAFTLIELLVVIAIIAILAAILFPVFAQAKLAAKKTAGLSGCKQIALGDIMYANDYDDFIVPTMVIADPGAIELPYEEFPGTAAQDNAYDHLLMPYIKSQQLWVDPGGPTGTPSSFYPAYKNLTVNGDASVDLSSWAWFTNTPVSGSSILYPSDLILQGDGQAQPYNNSSNFSGAVDSGVSACYAWENVASNTPQNSFTLPYVLYNGGANYAMADGHAKALTVSQTLFPNVRWFKEFPTAASMAAAPEGGGFVPPASPTTVSPTMDCNVFQEWNGDGGF